MDWTKDNLTDGQPFSFYKKKTITSAKRIIGPFTVETREGPLSCPDGYLAVDSKGWPYPIAKDEFEAIYEQVEM